MSPSHCAVRRFAGRRRAGARAGGSHRHLCSVQWEDVAVLPPAVRHLVVLRHDQPVVACAHRAQSRASRQAAGWPAHRRDPRTTATRRCAALQRERLRQRPARDRSHRRTSLGGQLVHAHEIAATRVHGRAQQAGTSAPALVVQGKEAQRAKHGEQVPHFVHALRARARMQRIGRSMRRCRRGGCAGTGCMMDMSWSWSQTFRFWPRARVREAKGTARRGRPPAPAARHTKARRSRTSKARRGP